jgi:DNA-binding MarR family transcriptional regulator
MSFSQFLVLMALMERGDSKQSAIAAYVGVTPAVITKQVDQLAGRGWLQMGPSHNDRRANVVRLTKKGQSEAQAALKVVQGAFNDQARFPDHYRTKLDRWLDLQKF